MSTPTRLRIAGGTVYDPANVGGADGVVRDVCIEGDRIVAELPASAPRLDARGMVVMPGGVDIHAHLAGSSVNLARRLLPEEHTADPVPALRLADGAVARSGTGGTVPGSRMARSRTCSEPCRRFRSARPRHHRCRLLRAARQR